MVQWQGSVKREDSGRKAALMDSIDSLQVPNFFVLTRNETERIVGDAETTEDILDSEIPSEIGNRIKEAYGEIGMSSEVRGASDEARELVEGQRETQRVSVRISGSRKGVYKSRLNVGSSKLMDAVKDVVASYYTVENDEDYPAVIVQKMVEPDLSGAAIIDYAGDKRLLEAVEGIGTSLEDGITVPEIYIVGDDGIDVRVPDRQLKVSRHPMNGDYRRQQVRKDGRSFTDSEIAELFQKIEKENLSVKFAYKRGTFYIVDAFPVKGSEAAPGEVTTDGIRVSPGEIKGKIGEGVKFRDQPPLPEEYGDAVIARKGGYISTAAQRARDEEKPAIFSFRGELQQGQQVSLGPMEITVEESHESSPESVKRDLVTASEILPINSGGGVSISPPFTGKYAVTDRDVAATKIPESGYLSRYSEVFSFEGERAVLDARFLPQEGLEAAIRYLDADLKILLLDSFETEVVEAAIESGFTVFGAESRLGELGRVVAREEKRFMMDRLRE